MTAGINTVAAWPAKHRPTIELLSPNTVTVRDRAIDLTGYGLAVEPESWEDGLRETPRPGTFEWWYADMRLDDGTSLVIVFETKALTKTAKPLTPRLSLTLCTPDGQAREERQEFDPREFTASRDHCDVVLGPNHLRGDLRQYEIHVEAPHISGDFVLTGDLPASRVGTGIVDFGPEGYLGWLVPVPRGQIVGTLTLDGATRTVTGVGYRDKNWGTLSFRHTLKEWYWARVHTDSYTAVYAELRALPTFRMPRTPLLLLFEGRNRILACSDGGVLEVEKGQNASGAPVLARSDFAWTDKLRVSLSGARLLQGGAKQRSHYQRFTAAAELVANFDRSPRTASGHAVAEHAVFN